MAKTREQCLALAKTFNPKPTYEQKKALDKLIAEQGADYAYLVISGATGARQKAADKQFIAGYKATGAKAPRSALDGLFGRGHGAKAKPHNPLTGLFGQRGSKAASECEAMAEALGVPKALYDQMLRSMGVDAATDLLREALENSGRTVSYQVEVS